MFENKKTRQIKTFNLIIFSFLFRLINAVTFSSNQIIINSASYNSILLDHIDIQMNIGNQLKLLIVKYLGIIQTKLNSILS